MRNFSSFLSALFFISIAGHSQNLVPNGDFETNGPIVCGWGSITDFTSGVTGWTSPTGGTPDVHSTLVSSTCTNFHPNPNHHSMCSNGSEIPHSGNTFTGFYTMVNGNPDYREYMQVQLASPMVPGFPYRVELYVSLGEESQFATNNIGVGFSTTITNSGSATAFGFAPQVNFSNVITDTTGWVQLTAVFVPTQPYEFIIIGNFLTDANTIITPMNPAGCWDRCYYYCDDVSIVPAGPVVSGQCFGDSTYFSLYPNPDVFANYWEFDDPASGADNQAYIANPAHLFTAPGIYNIISVNYHLGGTIDTFYTAVNIGTPPVFSLGNDTMLCTGDSIQLNTGSFSAYNWSTGATTSSIYVSVSGIYSVEVDNSGCKGSDTVSISFSPCAATIASLYSSDTTWCDKKAIDFFDLSTNNPTSWQWSFPGAAPATSNLQNPAGIYYANYGSYDVTLVACNPAGCDTLYLPGFINEMQIPSAPTVWSNDDTLWSSPAFAYQWYLVPNPIPGATGQYYIWSQTGSYYVEISDSNGCKVTSATIVIDGIPEHPFAAEKIKNIKVYDLAGRLLFVQNENIDFPKLNALLQSHPTGLYAVCMEGDGFRKVIKYFNGKE